MIRNSDVMRMLDNCARLKISAMVLDSQMCLHAKLKGKIPHFRGAPDTRIRLRADLEELQEIEAPNEAYFQVFFTETIQSYLRPNFDFVDDRVDLLTVGNLSKGHRDFYR